MLTFQDEFEIAVGELRLKPNEFWALTYAEFIAIVEGYQRTQKERINELIYLAWHIEAFARQKNLPPLKGILQNTDIKHREQTDDEMLAMCKILNAAFGGEVVET